MVPVRVEKLALVRKYIGKRESDCISDAEITEVSNLRTHSLAETYETPEIALVKIMRLTNGPEYQERCQEFVVAWRDTLVDVLTSQHLSPGWDVQRPCLLRTSA